MPEGRRGRSRFQEEGEATVHVGRQRSGDRLATSPLNATDSYLPLPEHHGQLPPPPGLEGAHLPRWGRKTWDRWGRSWSVVEEAGCVSTFDGGDLFGGEALDRADEGTGIGLAHVEGVVRSQHHPV